jgi:hypothetical protein
MSRKKTSLTKPLLISLTLSLAVFVAGVIAIDKLSLSFVAAKLLWPLARLMLFILVGLAVGQIIELAGWTRALARLSRPIFQFARLGDRCSAAFTTAFFSGTAANAMLMEFYSAGTINKKQLYLTNLLNQLPAYFLHVPTTFFIILPLTKTAGVIYFALTLIAALLRTAVFMVYGHRNPAVPAPVGETPVESHPDNGEAPARPAGIWPGVKQKLPGRIGRVAVWVVPMYISIFMVNAMGFFESARSLLADFVVTAFIPVESLSLVILSFVAEFTSGFAAAGALLDAGVLTTKQAVLALIIGNIVAFPVRALRHQLPRYVGIFAPKMGTQLLLLGQGLRITSVAMVATIYYFIG